MKHLSSGVLAALLYSTLAPSLAVAQHQHDAHNIEEIIVTISQQRSRSDTALPVSVLSGERLMQNASATLGETIQDSLGVHSSGFGAGVGQPVIRGLAGHRVTVLQNSLPSLDAAGASQDHASSVEALLAERIEIIRAPPRCSTATEPSAAWSMSSMVVFPKVCRKPFMGRWSCGGAVATPAAPV